MGYVVAGYGLTLGALGAYAVWVLRRARVLARRAEGDGAASR